MRGSSGKVNIALSELPDFTCLPGPGPLHRGAISISPSMEYIERAYDEAKYGQFSERPYIDMVIPSMIDRDMAPPGQHVMSCFVQYAPYDIEGGWDDAKRAAFGETVISTIEQYAPNIRRAIVGMQVITPKDIERIAGITGGNIFHGELLLHQLFFLRPAPQWADFRTPLPGYYFGASGAHPGGGVMGAAGKLAAQKCSRTGSEAMAGVRRHRHRRRPQRPGRGRAISPGPGRKVLVLERRDVAGGQLANESWGEGFGLDPLHAGGSLRPDIARELGLAPDAGDRPRVLCFAAARRRVAWRCAPMRPRAKRFARTPRATPNAGPTSSPSWTRRPASSMPPIARRCRACPRRACARACRWRNWRGSCAGWGAATCSGCCAR